MPYKFKAPALSQRCCRRLREDKVFVHSPASKPPAAEPQESTLVFLIPTGKTDEVRIVLGGSCEPHSKSWTLRQTALPPGFLEPVCPGPPEGRSRTSLPVVSTVSCSTGSCEVRLPATLNCARAWSRRPAAGHRRPACQLSSPVCTKPQRQAGHLLAI